MLFDLRAMKLKFRIISLDNSVLYAKKEEKELPIRVIINRQNQEKEERGRLIF
jgi:hypothetical protein